jgi:ssDNA-binding Zn-finger/Zn-ribbon topoisomerase 1
VGAARCKAGHCYGGFTAARALPCLPSQSLRHHCADYQAEGLAAVEAREKAHEDFSKKCTRARVAILAEWEKTKARGGSLPCPVCGAGILHWSRAEFNGHIRAGCTVPDCVRWIE